MDDPLWLRLVRLAVGDCGCFFSVLGAMFIGLVYLVKCWYFLKDKYNSGSKRNDEVGEISPCLNHQKIMTNGTCPHCGRQ